MAGYYFVYILLCNDGSFYTGFTCDLAKGLNQHNSAKVAGYTASRLPVKLVFVEEFGNVWEAIKLERQIKGWRREKKQALIERDFQKLVELSKTSNVYHPSTCLPTGRQAQDDSVDNLLQNVDHKGIPSSLGMPKWVGKTED